MSEFTISYGYTKNLGNYESERVDFSVKVTEGEMTSEEAYEQVRTFVRERLQLDKPAGEVPPRRRKF